MENYLLHISSHAIAIIALFIACFAITGYISYRFNSIPTDSMQNVLKGTVKYTEGSTVAVVTLNGLEDHHQILSIYTKLPANFGNDIVSVTVNGTVITRSNTDASDTNSRYIAIYIDSYRQGAHKIAFNLLKSYKNSSENTKGLNSFLGGIEEVASSIAG